MINLWDETIDELKEHDKSWDEVIYVAGDSVQITRSNFEEVSKRTYYDNGYGSPEVAMDLKLYGYSFILKRYEYDGSECWEYIDIRYPKHLPIEEVELLAYRGATLKEIKELSSKYDY